MDQLRQEGYPVELKLLTGKPHDEMQQAILDADVVIDQLMVGWYGNFAVEAMASSRPVIAHVREELVNRTGSPPPILNAIPTDLQQVLRRLLDDSALRSDLARAGRPYVAQVHDANHIAEQLVACYDGIRS